MKLFRQLVILAIFTENKEIIALQNKTSHLNYKLSEHGQKQTRLQGSFWTTYSAVNLEIPLLTGSYTNVLLQEKKISQKSSNLTEI